MIDKDRSAAHPDDPARDTFTGRVTREAELPAELRARSGLDRVDYADAFRTTNATTQGWSALHWAEHVLDAAPARTRAQLVAGWLSLGLRIVPTRADRLLGWTVQSHDLDCTVLSADSVIGLRAELIFARHRNAWWFGTRLTLGNAVARAVWTPVEIVHPGAVQRLLENANDRLDEG